MCQTQGTLIYGPLCLTILGTTSLRWGHLKLQDIGAPPTPDELFSLLGRGSDATSLDELPRCVLQHIMGYGAAAVCYFLAALHGGMRSSLLNTVLHVPLKKEGACMAAS